jgi:methyltransferase (TIGR00027 family)
MDPGQPSRSAMGAAEARATHRLSDPPPWILDDPFALALVGPQWEELAAESRMAVRAPVARQGRAGVAVRSRYAEDRLLEGAFAQYVILGAGLDSFAWRHPDLLNRLTVYEVDHPATQTWKRHRMSALGLPVHPRHEFVPLDFETGTLRSGLDASGFDWAAASFFSATGLMMYLTADAIEATVRTVAGCPAGSEIVLSYNLIPSLVDRMGHEFLDAVTRRATRMGEPLQTCFSPADAEALVVRCGLAVVDHPTRDDLCDRYFAGRSDGLRPYTLERLMAAGVDA